MVKGGSLKILLPLAIAASILTVFLYQKQEQRSGERFEKRKLLPELDIEAIRRVELEAGENRIALVGSGESWSLESLPGFPIEPNRLRELILALAALEASDRMTDKPRNYDRLGVQEETPSGGRVKLLDENQKILADVFVGDEREGRATAPGGFSPSEGQYVRIGGDPWVYKTNKIVSLASDRTQWLEKELLKVKAEDLQSIQIDNAATTESFVLARGSSGELELENEIPTGMQIKDWAIDNVGRALSNLSLTDVLPASDSAVEFDGAYRAIQKNGLVYEVHTATREEKYFARIAAQYDSSLNLGLSDERTSDSVEALAMPDPETEALELRERHEPWVYEISEFAHGNLSKSLSDLLEPIREETPPSAIRPDAGPETDQEIEDFLSGLQNGGSFPPPAP